MVLSTFFIALYLFFFINNYFLFFYSFFLLTVDVLQDFFGSIIIQLFLSSFIACLHRFACCWLFLLFNLWETGMGCLTFSGEGRKSLGFCFYGLEKLFFFFFFQALFIFFCCGSEKLFFRLYLPFFCLLQILLSFITMFGLLYGFIVFIVLFEERCLVVYERIRMWVPEVDKCLGEVVDRYSL